MFHYFLHFLFTEINPSNDILLPNILGSPDFHVRLNGITRFALNQNKNGDILSVIYFIFEDGTWGAEYVGQKYVIGWIDFTEKEVQEIVEHILKGKIKYAFGLAYEKIISRNPDRGEENDRPDNA